jgi:hypothetical protein
MIQNTVQTLIDYVKDLTGQSNASTAKIIRALNFAVDNYSYIKITSSGRWKWDSRSQGDLNVVSTTTSDSILTLEDELTAIQSLEVLVDGSYKLLENIDQRDVDRPLSTLTTGNSYPAYFDPEGRFVRLYPAPTGSYTYRLTYTRPHPRYSADALTAETGIEPIHEEYIALYAADRLMIGSNDPSRTAIRNELSVKEREIRDLSSKRDQSRPMKLPMKINVLS